MSANRGVFLVLEGCDRSGKSTQCKKLAHLLTSKGFPVKQMRFPERTTKIGQVINSYLTKNEDISNECIHLLFSANRWEYSTRIEDLLKAGINVVMDRYSHSGIAYSVAKGLDYDWCMASEKNLVKPDGIFYLKSTIQGLLDRQNFGKERFETIEFQQRVAEVFDRMSKTNDSLWVEIDALLPEVEISEKISQKALIILDQVKQTELGKF